MPPQALTPKTLVVREMPGSFSNRYHPSLAPPSFPHSRSKTLSFSLAPIPRSPFFPSHFPLYPHTSVSLSSYPLSDSLPLMKAALHHTESFRRGEWTVFTALHLGSILSDCSGARTRSSHSLSKLQPGTFSNPAQVAPGHTLLWQLLVMHSDNERQL